VREKAAGILPVANSFWGTMDELVTHQAERFFGIGRTVDTAGEQRVQHRCSGVQLTERRCDVLGVRHRVASKYLERNRHLYNDDALHNENLGASAANL
jgi:hypothetical protein